ncbi:alpha-glucosidase/alpha-galactosidase [Kutzneria viridogrisea]|uniref:Glycoside hydrolase family 4 n=2 Tax=Kutzneria TaxID=43356 RepID=W5W7H7_9PSEU|nr:alpha-galactosidase [Kutzneria albida]AHH96887.1 glycoside hydrolase family 4 [Kutzneria albida DSM 43870]MBA8927890.1 alpha-galactosidase [Kutzneria viridogrisea]
MAKVAFIGAGGAPLTRALLADLLGQPELADLTLALHDPDHERLETVEALARWTAAQAGVTPKITAHTDQRPALDGADYVVNTTEVGGHEAAALDYRLPASYGVRQTHADTLGVGGVFRALRAIPVIRELTEDMAQLCPDAWLLNHAAPLPMLTWAVSVLSPHTKVIGLSRAVPDTVDRLARLAGVPADQVGFLAAGAGGQSFVLRLEHAGTDLHPRLDEALARSPELAHSVRVEMYRRLGHFPTADSQRSAEYVPWFLHDDEAIRTFRLRPGAALVAAERELADYRQTRSVLFGGEVVPLPAQQNPGAPTEFATRFVHAMQTGRPRALYGLVRNTGLIGNLPEDACVEVPCLVDGSGAHPMPVGGVPPQLAALNRAVLSVCELTVLAAVEGRRDHVHHALLADPNTAATLSPRDIHRLCDAMISAHGALMPDWVRAPGWLC